MMATRHILVVEDDHAIREGIVDALTFAGYRVLEAENATRATDMTISCDYDLLLLDLVLPDGDGFDILQKVRGARPIQPVIILTARGEEKDRVRGLKLGADDYVVKPFSVDELLARVEAVLRRSPQRPTDVRTVTIPTGLADLDRCEVRFDDGTRTPLSERERELLRYLVTNPGRAVSRRSCSRPSGGLILPVSRPERSTCTSRVFARNCATRLAADDCVDRSWQGLQCLPTTRAGGRRHDAPLAHMDGVCRVPFGCSRGPWGL